MDKKIEDFNEALRESIIKNFGSLENAQEYADKLSIKNNSREEAFLKRVEERQTVNNTVDNSIH